MGVVLEIHLRIQALDNELRTRETKLSGSIDSRSQSRRDSEDRLPVHFGFV